MNVGDYARTKNGVIAKCIEEKHDRYVFDRTIIDAGYYQNYEYKDVVARNSHIIKSSPNIIDLIEVGDYVNGGPVCLIKEDENNKKWIYTDSNYKVGILENEIEDVVTHEQFEEMKYEVK